MAVKAIQLSMAVYILFLCLLCSASLQARLVSAGLGTDNGRTIPEDTSSSNQPAPAAGQQTEAHPNPPPAGSSCHGFLIGIGAQKGMLDCFIMTP